MVVIGSQCGSNLKRQLDCRVNVSLPDVNVSSEGQVSSCRSKTKSIIEQHNVELFLIFYRVVAKTSFQR